MLCRGVPFRNIQSHGLLKVMGYKSMSWGTNQCRGDDNSMSWSTIYCHGAQSHRVPLKVMGHSFNVVGCDPLSSDTTIWTELAYSG